MELVRFCVSFILAFVTIQPVSALFCYNCSSLLDPKCGVEWQFSADSDAYRVECPANATHCAKHIILPQTKLEVFRSCWEPWENHTDARPEGCHEVGKETEVCLCADPKRACNSDISLAASVPEIIAGALFSFIAVFY